MTRKPTKSEDRHDQSVPPASKIASGPVQLPRPTPDQENYLDEIRRSSNQFDPNIVIGGPQRRS